MKHLYFIVGFLLLSANTLTAQKIRYTDTANFWTVTWDIGGDVSGPSPNYLFYIDDTVYGGYNYYRQCNYDNFSCWVREDTLLGKVYYRETFDSVERILFDYNLAIGDTLASYNFSYAYNYPNVFVLTSIDSVLINNVPHVVQYFGFADGSFFWPDFTFVIEGLGCIEGARMPMPPHPDPGSVITCFRNHGIRPTIDPAIGYFDNYISCNANLSLSANEISNRKFSSKVVPNPANNTSSIIFGKPVNGNLRIVNCVGQEVINRLITSTDKISLGDMSLKPSLYYYRLIDSENKEVFSGKFIYE